MKNVTRDESLYLPEVPFTGTLVDLLAHAKAHPFAVASSKATLHRLIVREGVNVLRSEKIQRIYGKEIVAYNAFSGFHGIEPYIHAFVTDFLGAAVKGAEADKQVAVLIGPKGSGKSQFVKALKKLLTRCEPLPFLEGCPMHENPLNALFLIPEVAQLASKREKRATREIQLEILQSLKLDELIDWSAEDVRKILKAQDVEPTLAGLSEIRDVDALVSAIVFGLGLPRSTRANIGHPCPYCQERALGQFDAEAKVTSLAEFPIDSFWFKDDQQGSVGIASVKEVQPLNFNIDVMRGEENIAALGNVDRYDPRSVLLNGAYNLANRGLLEFVEGFKNPKEAHRSVLEATQDKSIPAPDPLRRNIHVDTVIIYHSNAPEFREFKNDAKNEPYLDRFVVIYFGYPLEYSEAKKVVEKLWTESDFARPVTKGGIHLEPTVTEYMAIYEVLTRLEDDATIRDLMIKLWAYNGDEGRLRGMGTKIDVAALKRNATPYEGMEGVSPRFTAKLLTAIASEALARGKCVTSRELRDRLYAEIRLIQDDKLQERYRTFVGKYLDDWRRKKLARVVLAALVESFKPECQNVFDRYFDNVTAYIRKTNVKSSGSLYGRSPDEDFMRAIESDPDLNITSAQADKFRAEVVSAVQAYMDEHKTFDKPYTCYEPLKNAIERFVCGRVKDTARILSSTSVRNDEDNRKLQSALDRMVKDYGFCRHCAEQVLKEAEETRDFLKEV
jgi:serine protein kinase